MAQHRLEAVLAKKKLSKRKFAKMIGKNYEGTFRYYRPKFDPKLSTLTLWAKALKCKVRDLIEE